MKTRTIDNLIPETGGSWVKSDNKKPIRTNYGRGQLHRGGSWGEDSPANCLCGVHLQEGNAREEGKDDWEETADEKACGPPSNLAKGDRLSLEWKLIEVKKKNKKRGA